MKIKLFLFLALSVSLYADQVTMKNGDRFSGTIQKFDGKSLTMKSDYAGVIVVPWDAVVSIKSESSLSVVLKDGKTIEGTVTSGAGKLEVATAQAKQEVETTEVTALRDADEQKAYERLLHPGWTQLWAGALNLGLAGTAGNSRTSVFTTGLNAARVTNTDKTSIYFAAVKSSATLNGKSADTAQTVRGGWGYNHDVSSRLFVNVFNDYEYDKFQNLDLRFVFGGGLGFSAIKNDKSRLDLLAGIDYAHANFSPKPTTSSAEAYWGDDYSYKLSKSTSLVQSFRMFNNLSDLGAYRMNFDAGAATQLTKWLTWNVTLSDRYLSTPAPGRKRNDFLYSTGVGVNFAR